MNKFSIAHLPLVSIIIPCRNEEKFIGDCLDSIIANSYPTDHLEVLVIDGVSEDGTRAAIESYAGRYSWIRLIENPEKITPVALNIGIKNARGEIIIWMSAHNCYDNNYISRCVESLEKYGADNVGGVMKTLPREDSFMGQAIIASLSHRFGVGNSYFRVQADEPKWVDTVFGGCYRREVFDRVGLFNENLVRGQDMEFNLRLKKAGGKTLLVPNIVSYYYARSDLKSFLEHNWNNGKWAILPFLYSPIVPVSWRHLVPLIFVASLLLTAMLGLFFAPFLRLFLVILGSYILVSLATSFQIALQKRDIRFVIIMPLIFGMLHFGYGFGSLLGVFKVLRTVQFWKNFLGWKRS
jgi:glycosyltransferase involved in cell wall biosynthesis